MIVPGDFFTQVYDAMRKDAARSEDKGFLIFAASGDVDSVCASQVLLHLCNREANFFSAIPVQCYEQIRDYCASLTDAEELKNIILINCGASEDIRSLCHLPPNIRIVILDSHRPVWHGHNNEADTDTLVMVDGDDPVPKGQVPAFNAELDAQVISEDPSDDDEDDEEEEEDGDKEDEGEEEEEEGRDPGEGAHGRKRRRGSGGAGPSGRPAKRSPGERAADAAARSVVRQQRAAEVDAYYSNCNGFGKPTSLLLYTLAHRLQQDDFFHIWCAITALTEQLIFQQISKQQYNVWREELVKDVAMHANAEDEPPTESLISLPKHKVHVEPFEDLRLTLLRHWTMEDSIRYTAYVASRLQTWRQKGVDNIRSLLTYMCIPIKQATTPYKGLREVFFGQLRTQLPRVAPKHMLAWDSLHMQSFRLQYQHEELSASDMVFALMGLLTDVQPHRPDWHAAAFANASDALHVMRNLPKVEAGIEAAKKLCADVVHECGMLVSNNFVKGGRTADYRFVNMAETNMATHIRFRHPTVLKYAALFMRDATANRYSSTDARRPMVLAGPPDERGACCVVAVQAKHISGNRVQVNPFARPMLDAAAALSLSQVSNGFDNCTYHVRKEDLQPFLAKLQDVVGEYSRLAEVQRAAADADGPGVGGAAADAAQP